MATLVLFFSVTVAGGADYEPWFEDVTADRGLDFVHFNGMTGELYFVENMGAGVALFDYDGDGDLDVYLVQGHLLGSSSGWDRAVFPPADWPLVDRLYRSDSIVDDAGDVVYELVDVTPRSGLWAPGYGMGAAVGDYDRDGDLDLYVTNFGPNQLFRNRGDGTFEEATATAGVEEMRWSVPASFVDIDDDGWLDLFVGNYVELELAANRWCPDFSGRGSNRDYCGALTFEPERDRLFRNLGDGSFEDLSGPTGLASVKGRGMGLLTGDLDGDRRVDVYVTNDATPNVLWGRENGRLRDMAMIAGVGVNGDGRAEASMGVAGCDLGRDGFEDLVVTHLDVETNTLYRQVASGLFVDATESGGVGGPSRGLTGFGVVFDDLDLDGWCDLAIANGRVELDEVGLAAGDPYPLAQPASLLRGNPKGRFEAVPSEAARLGEQIGRGLAGGDLDNDGDTDLVMTANAGPAVILDNLANATWIGVAGAVTESAVIVADGANQWERSRRDGSYASSADARPRFGGFGPPPEAVRVVPEEGAIRRFEAPPVNRYLVVRGQSHPAVEVPERVAADRRHDGAWLSIAERPAFEPDRSHPRFGQGRTGPNDSGALVAAAVRRSREGRHDEAAATYRRLVEAAPENVAYRQQLARELLESDQPTLALEAVDEALRLTPGHVVSHLTRARTLERLERTGEAEAAYRRALDLAPGSRSALRALGRLSAQRGDLRSAGDAFDRALRYDPFDPSALLGRARSRTAAGDVAAALDDVTRALEVVPSDAAAVVAEQALLHRLGQGAEADRRLELRLDDGELGDAGSEVLVRSADIRARRGRGQSAATWLEDGVSRFPGSEIAIERAAVFHATVPEVGLRNGELSLELAERLAPEAAGGRGDEVRAMALAALGQYAAAERIQQRLLSLADPSGPALHRYRTNLDRYRSRRIAAPE